MTVGKFSRHSAQSDLIWQLHKSLFWSFQSDVRTACQIMQLFREVVSMINFRDYFLDAVKEVSHYFGCHVFWWFIFVCLTEGARQLPNCSEASGMPTSGMSTGDFMIGTASFWACLIQAERWVLDISFGVASGLPSSNLCRYDLKLLGVQHPD